MPLVGNNGLRAWPTVEDYAKLKRKGRGPQPRTRPKRVILHVGTWKTGTKALQKFFALNRKELEQQGILYPLTPGAPYLEGGNRTYQSRLASGGAADRRERLEALAAEIHASACDTCLISHENICNLPQSALVEFISCLSGCRFEIVLYLRRQDYYAESLYNQHVKAGVTFAGDFAEHFARYRDRYDYRRMIVKLDAVFGARNILVRPYETEQFYGETIFADFVYHVFDQEIGGRYALPERDHNARLARDALEFKRIVNGLEGSKEEKFKLGQYLIKYCESVDPRIRQSFQAHGLLSPAERVRLLEEFAAGNAWIAREYLGRSDAALFQEPWRRTEDPWSPYPGLSAAKAAEIAFHLCQAMEREAGDRAIERPKVAIFGRAMKRRWKRSLQQGKALVVHLWAGSERKSEGSDSRPSAVPKPPL